MLASCSGATTAASTLWLTVSKIMPERIQVGLNGSNSADLTTAAGTSYNVIGALQLSNGASNDASIEVNSGYGNLAVTAQYGEGSGTNTADISISGNLNNVQTSSPYVRSYASDTSARQVATQIGSISANLGGNAHYLNLLGSTAGGYIGSREGSHAGVDDPGAAAGMT